MFQKLQLKQRDFFKICQSTFACIGIDVLAKDNSFIIKHPFICCGLYIPTLLYALSSIYVCTNKINDINQFTVVISALNQLVIALWKITVFVVKRQRIHKLIRDVWQWNENADKEEIEIISKICSKNASISKLYFMTVLFAGLLALLRPFIIKLLQFTQGLERVLEVPHEATNVWDTTSFIGYSAAYIWNIAAIHFLVNASVAIDTLFLWLISNIIIRFQILRMRLKTAAAQNQQILLRNIIKDIVQFHLHIFYLVRELDAIFSEIIFVKSIISCSQICFLTFCLMNKNVSIVNMMHPFIFLLAVSFQLFLYCYNGNLVEEESLKVSTDIFKYFNWSQMSKCNQKMLQMIMLRSQRISHITGIFFNLNLSLYLWFYKTAASLIAVLRTLEG